MIQYIYVLLFYLPSAFGRLTQKLTHYQYTHAAISLDDSYEYFYAFSRLRAKTPPVSGYIEEKRIYYTLGEPVPIQTRIFKVPLSHEGYDNAVRFMRETRDDPKIMYNLLNMLLIPFFGGAPVYKAYNCGEFVAKVLEAGGIRLHLPYYKYVPESLTELLREYIIFEGTLPNTGTVDPDDDFFQETAHRVLFCKTCAIVAELLFRQATGRASRHFDPGKVRF